MNETHLSQGQVLARAFTSKVKALHLESQISTVGRKIDAFGSKSDGGPFITFLLRIHLSEAKAFVLGMAC